MSIPRIAIERPVTMFMISMVIILLGGISLTRLPVDLMPDTQMPTITVRVNYSGVGPLEMEELVTRPIEQAVSAVAGLERVDSTSSEGNANVRLNFAWGTDLSEAADEVRTRLDRVRGRMPEDADPPTVFKFDSTAMPIMGIGVEGDFDPVTLREIAQNDLSPRLERVAGVAAVTINGGLRRQIHVDLSREKITGAQPLARSRRPDPAHREPEHPARRNQRRRPHAAAAQPRPVHQHRRDQEHRRDDARRRAGLHARHRRRHRRHRGSPLVHAHQRRQRHPHAGDQAVGHQHHPDRRRREEGSRAHQRRDPGHEAADPRRPVALHRAARSAACRSTPCSAACWSSRSSTCSCATSSRR